MQIDVGIILGKQLVQINGEHSHFDVRSTLAHKSMHSGMCQCEIEHAVTHAQTGIHRSAKGATNKAEHADGGMSPAGSHQYSIPIPANIPQWRCHFEQTRAGQNNSFHCIPASMSSA